MWTIANLAGRVVQVDLSFKKVSDFEVEKGIYRKFLGGRGLHKFLLFQKLDRNTAPLDAENLIVFGTGLLTGTGAPGAIRLSIDTKSTFSAGVGSVNAGGDFGCALKSAGVGTVMVTGKSKCPVYIAIGHGHVTIHGASYLWGIAISETIAGIQSALGEAAKVLCIGPAGEHLVRGVNAMVDGSRAAAKCGVGAVMGSKNLKTIAVAGTQQVTVSVAEPCPFRALSQRLWKTISQSVVAEILDTNGSLACINAKNLLGEAPFRYYQDGYIDQNKADAITEGPYAGTEGDAMQRSTIQDFGIKLDISDPAVLLKANLLCNEYGLDMDTVSESVAWAFECFQKGILDPEETDGLALHWGNASALLALIKKIAYRRGFGNTLAEGTKRAAEIVGKGSERLAVTMKGQDLYEAVQMPKGYGLAPPLQHEVAGTVVARHFVSSSTTGSRPRSLRACTVSPQLVILRRMRGRENWSPVMSGSMLS